MSGDQPEIVLNEFGDLSRKARRELLARGIDPDTAVLEHIRTAAIPVVAPSFDTPEEIIAENAISQVDEVQVDSPVEQVATDSVTEMSAPVAQFDDIISGANVPEAPMDVSTTTAEVFPASMSKRDIFHILNRNQTEEQTEELVAEVSNGENEASANGLAAELVVKAKAAETDSAVPDAPGENFESPSVDEQDEESESSSAGEDNDAPQTIAEITASQAPVVEFDENDIEPFSDTTTSTGIIATSSHALIIPTLPEETGSIAPVVPTGEILITGSILLPSSIAQVGADVEALDTSEIDIIADDQEIVASQALAPVSATTAVSSYNTNNTVQTVPRRLNDRLPFILSIAAAGLAVAVVGLFIVGSIMGLF